ncbi:6-phosphogluconolactonase [Salmonella enterica subsp. enterica serovar Heidelberg str. CFSAN002075]|nr:6-phosphogluconolactonase [Salmonella enterica subsp. enterica serovar Heidelberg str. CFSAN002075]
MVLLQAMFIEITGTQGLLTEKGRYAVGQGPMWVVVNAY